MSALTIDEAKQKQKNEAFLKLVKKNPTLPIVPMVDYEIVGEDWSRWLGAFGSAYVGEYACYDDRYFEDREDYDKIFNFTHFQKYDLIHGRNNISTTLQLDYVETATIVIALLNL